MACPRTGGTNEALAPHPRRRRNRDHRGGRIVVGGRPLRRSPARRPLAFGEHQVRLHPKGLSSRGFTPVLRCSLDHADYAVMLQHRCESGDWHGFTLTPTKKPLIFCPGGASGDHPVDRTLAYGQSWRRGPFTCTSRVTGVPAATGLATAYSFPARRTALGSTPGRDPFRERPPGRSHFPTRD